MQGRLSPRVAGRIQAFPWSTWRDEFPIAERLGFRVMEWTLDQERLYENPLLSAEGREEILALCERHRLGVPSLTGDCFMQAPFWKDTGGDRETRQADFKAVAEACAALGISLIVLPLVDNGRIETRDEETALVTFLEAQTDHLATLGARVAVECDLGPAELADFISRFEPAAFGVNYDIGNSAALGFDPVEEIAAYGDRVINVHVKDRVRGGPTVPLGTGAADFDAAFAALGEAGYTGNYVLQAARAGDDDHAGALSRYRDMTVTWMSRHAA